MDFPEFGRVGRVKTMRELVISAKPFIAVYRVSVNKMNILALLHGLYYWG
jgi:hypothetical protein